MNIRQEVTTMSESIEQAVQSKYGSVAKSGLSTGHSGVRAVAEACGQTLKHILHPPHFSVFRASVVTPDRYRNPIMT
jgi:hypothetical protein